MAEKTHWKVLVDTNYLGAYSFNEQVNSIIVTIKNVTAQEVFNPKENKAEVCRVMTFEETEVNGIEIKPFIINKTNCETIEKLYGTGYIEDWIGKRITLFKTSIKVAGDDTDCIRVKKEIPPFKAKAQTPQYTCSVCGKPITQKVYDAAIQKFGVAVCSKECASKVGQDSTNDATDNKEDNSEENN